MPKSMHEVHESGRHTRYPRPACPECHVTRCPDCAGTGQRTHPGDGGSLGGLCSRCEGTGAVRKTA